MLCVCTARPKLSSFAPTATAFLRTKSVAVAACETLYTGDTAWRGGEATRGAADAARCLAVRKVPRLATETVALAAGVLRLSRHATKAHRFPRVLLVLPSWAAAARVCPSLAAVRTRWAARAGELLVCQLQLHLAQRAFCPMLLPRCPPSREHVCNVGKQRVLGVAVAAGSTV